MRAVVPFLSSRLLLPGGLFQHKNEIGQLISITYIKEYPHHTQWNNYNKMKRIFLVTAWLVFVWIRVVAQNNAMKISPADSLSLHHEKENALGSAILNALKNKNIAEWLALYPSNDEFKGILQVGLAAKVEGLTQEKIDAMIERRKKEAAAVYEAEFKGYQRQADSLHIQWKDAIFDKFNFEAVYPEEVHLKYLNGDIRFSCKQDHFIIDGIQAVEIETGYRLQDVKSIRRPEVGE